MRLLYLLFLKVVKKSGQYMLVDAFAVWTGETPELEPAELDTTSVPPEPKGMSKGLKTALAVGAGVAAVAAAAIAVAAYKSKKKKSKAK